MNKRKEVIEAIDKCIETGFTGNIQINFDRGHINNRINLGYSQLLIDKNKD